MFKNAESVAGDRESATLPSTRQVSARHSQTTFDPVKLQILNPGGAGSVVSSVPLELTHKSGPPKKMFARRGEGVTKTRKLQTNWKPQKKDRTEQPASQGPLPVRPEIPPGVRAGKCPHLRLSPHCHGKNSPASPDCSVHSSESLQSTSLSSHPKPRPQRASLPLPGPATAPAV